MSTSVSGAASLLVVSGCASLIYQVAWVRLLGLSMGSTSASVSTVLAAFFLGLALGSYLSERITRRPTGGLLVYVVLELVIALSGLVLLPVLLNLDRLLMVLPVLGTRLEVKFVLTLGLLLLPTLAMGATFPVLATTLIKRQSDMGSGMGQLYTLNTAGAVLGAAMTGFVLVPRLGLDGAIYVAASLNVVAAVLAAWSSRRPRSVSDFPTTPVTATSIEAPVTTPQSTLQRLALIVLFTTGFVSIGTEVGWTKYLAVFTGATIYGFAAILTIFLAGIALGAALMRKHVDSIAEPAVWLAGGLVGLAATLVLARFGLSQLPFANALIHERELTGAVQQAFRFVCVSAVLLAPTVCFGALFPLTLKIYCGHVDRLNRFVGRGYAMNTLGSILGAVVAGFWLIPALGTDRLLVLMVLVLVANVLLLAPSLAGNSRRIVIGLAAGVALLVLAAPGIDYRHLIGSVRYAEDPTRKVRPVPDYLYLKEGKSSVISVAAYDDNIGHLQSNGIQESSVYLVPASTALLIESLLGYAPYFLHPEPSTAFVVGFGGGHTLTALTHTSLDSIRVVELEPAIVDAVASLPMGEPAALSDPRVSLAFNDARNALLVEGETYDIIASQPSHPWLAGAGNLFTQRFFEIVRSQLNRDGLFVQWVNLFYMDAQTLRAIFQAYYGVFEHGFTLADVAAGDLILIGSMEPIRFDFPRMFERMRIEPIRATLGNWSIHDVAGLLHYFALSRDDALRAAGDVEPNTDTRILSEVRLAGLTTAPSVELSPYVLIQRHARFHVTPFLDEQRATRQLADLALSFARRRSVERTSHLIDRLREIDPERARRLSGHRLVRSLETQ